MINTSPLAIIVATDLQGGIGYHGKIPWFGQFPEDLKFFVSTTKHAQCVMGYNTYADILTNHPNSTNDLLPNRYNYVLTDKDAHLQKATAIQSLDDIQVFGPIVIIGGSKTYQQYLHQTDVVFLTTIKNTYTCDAYFDRDYVTDRFSLSVTYLDNDRINISKWTR